LRFETYAQYSRVWELLSHLEGKANERLAGRGKGKGKKVPFLFPTADELCKHLLEHQQDFLAQFRKQKPSGGLRKRDLRIFVTQVGLRVLKKPGRKSRSWELVRKEQQGGGSTNSTNSCSSGSAGGHAKKKTAGEILVGTATEKKKKQKTTKSPSLSSFTPPPSTRFSSSAAPSSSSSLTSFDARFQAGLKGKMGERALGGREGRKEGWRDGHEEQTESEGGKRGRQEGQ